MSLAIIQGAAGKSNPQVAAGGMAGDPLYHRLGSRLCVQQQVPPSLGAKEWVRGEDEFSLSLSLFIQVRSTDMGT